MESNQILIEKRETIQKQLEKVEKVTRKLNLDLTITNDLIQINNLNYLKINLQKQKNPSSNKKTNYLKPFLDFVKDNHLHYYLVHSKYNLEDLINEIDYNILKIKSYLGPNYDYKS